MVLKIENLLKMSQEELLDFCYIELIKRGYKNKDIVYGDYIYAKGNIPVLLIAHCDIVHKDIPTTIVYDKQQRILWSPTGIGGDDRCGVYALLKICEKFKPYVLFTTDEEIGCVGAKKFTKDFDELPVNFMIEIDRRGNNQAVFYSCGNKEFQNYILSFGLDKQIGSCSDVKILSTEFDIAGCNLSAGYYNEHTTSEHIYLEHLDNTIAIVERILKDTKNHKFYDCQEIVYTKPTYVQKKWWEDYYEDYYDKYCKSPSKEEAEETQTEQEELQKAASEADAIMQKEEDYYALTPKEWKKKYKQNKPDNILEIY